MMQHIPSMWPRPDPPSRRRLHVNLLRDRGIHVPDIDISVMATRVDVSRVRASRRGEVTPNQGSLDFMTSEGNQRVVVRMLVEVIVIEILPSIIVVVEVLPCLREVRWLILFEPCPAVRHTQIPELHRLFFAVRENVSPIAFTVDVSDSLGVPDKGARRPTIAEGAGVPYFDGAKLVS